MTTRIGLDEILSIKSSLKNIFLQVAANVLLTEALKYRLTEIKAMDEEERFDHSPRKV